jgi:zinc protease
MRARIEAEVSMRAKFAMGSGLRRAATCTARCERGTGTTVLGRIAIVAVVGLLAAPALPGSGVASRTGPGAATGVSGTLTLPDIREHALGNGLRVFIVATHEVPLVSVRLLIPAGSALDGPGAEGVANLTGRLLMKGAGGLTAEQIAEMIEAVGGVMSVSTNRDFTVVQGEFLAKDLPRAVEILGKVALHPGFPGEELAREKALVAAEIAEVKEDPMELANREFARVLLGGHPYAHPVAGSAAAVDGLTREQVGGFHRQHYVPAGALFAVVGDVDPETALSLAEKELGGWQGAAAGQAVPELEPRPFPGRRVFVIHKPDATQSQIRIGNVAVRRDSPEYFALALSNTLLGGGFTSRLVEEVRVNRGLTYGVRSDLTRLKHGGYFDVATFTENKTLRETIDVVMEQLERIRTEQIADQELTNWKRYLTGLFPLGLEKNDDLAEWITDLTFYGIPLTFLAEYRARIEAVTAEECQTVAREHYWTDNDLILLVTNYEETKEQLAGLGEVQVVQMDEIE